MAAELTDEQIIDVADDFKSQHQACGVTVDEFDYFGFARAIWALALSAAGAEDAERPDPYIPLMADQAMSIDRHALRSALAWYGIAWREDSDEAFACYVGQYVNHLTTAIAAARTQSNGAAGGGEVSHGE